MFTKEIRDVIEEMCFLLEKEVSGIEKEQKKYTDFLSYCEEVPELMDALHKFAAANADLVNKNIKFANPPVFQDSGLVQVSISLGGELSGLAGIFDDFINYTCRCFLWFKNKKEKRQYFKLAWTKFQDDFFADEVEIKFRAFVYSFDFSHAGCTLESVVPEPNLGLRWRGNNPDSEIIFHILQKAQTNKHGGLEAYKWPNNPHCLLEYTTKVRKGVRLEWALKEARENFDKVCFLLRIISKGGAHYSCMVMQFPGNLMHRHDLAVYDPLNQQFTPLGDSKFGVVDDQLFQYYWPLIKKRSINEFRFQNQKYRDYAQIIGSKRNLRYGKSYELTLMLERIIDLVQIIEATIGDLGAANAVYIDQILDKTVEDKLGPLIRLRNKYVHGLPSEVDSIVINNFENDFYKLNESIEIFLHMSRLIMCVALKNPDIKKQLKRYHNKWGEEYIRKGVRPLPVENFPKFS